MLDVYHALEQVSDCGKMLYGKETKEYAVPVIIRWREETTLELMWNGFEGMKRRLQRLGEVAENSENAEKKESIRLLRCYLTFHRDRLGYRERLAAGQSLGSGLVEGACKNLIGRRLKQTGARWRVRRVNRMATLCAVLYGDQWNLYWNTAK